MDSQNFEIHTYLSYTYGRLGDENLIKLPYYQAKAMMHVNTALKLNPKCSHCYNAWAVAYGYLRMHNKAEDYLKKAISINPKNYWSYMQLGGTYLAMEKYNLAEENFKKAIELGEKDIRKGAKNDEIPRIIALYYEEVKMWTPALKYAKLALQWNPDDLQTLPKFSIKKLIKRLEKEKEQNETIPHRLQDELIVGGTD